MRLLRAIPLAITIVLVFLLDKPAGDLPAIGRLMDPVNGCWANAEPIDNDFSRELPFPDIKENVEVWFDERMVPHIKAGNDHDLYYVQGYIHAYFRLWQMDLQTRAAGGRISEVIGDKGLKFDRNQRRKGMVYGAENSLRMMESDPRTKTVLDAYRDGINAYINSIGFRDYPLEYKLMGFRPEEWTNLRTALLLMYMADDLTGKVDDIPLTYLKQKMPGDKFEHLFPNRLDGVTPVIPPTTGFDTPSLQKPGVPADAYLPVGFITIEEREDEGKGSNNWAIAPAKTKSGKPILCNDPHLSLNLPAIWFEVQLSAPGVNTYGVSLPGAPGVIIGFNDHISWGITNNYRDVKDFYLIRKTGKDKYLFDGTEKPFEKRAEVIKVKGRQDFIDTVDYTVHGPVTYDERFIYSDNLSQPLAMEWMAHNESNELLTFYLLNRATGYNEYVEAISHFVCPAQNFIYADNKGNIAIWGQGRFINKWEGQGRFIMNGSTSAAMWGAEIPVQENPHAINPRQGYLASANHTQTDSTYPYWYNGDFSEFRAWRINQALDTMQEVTVEDMFRLQNDDYSYLAARVLPVMLSRVEQEGRNSVYLNELQAWDYRLTAGSKAATTFRLWWTYFYNDLWRTRFAKLDSYYYPSEERTMQIMTGDTAYNKAVATAILSSYRRLEDSLGTLKNREWYRVKNTSLTHLAKLAPFGYTGINNGGWGHTVNAMKSDHGPSWRMVVTMNEKPEGYGVYPGGQSGNPGSIYYSSFVEKWADGAYYKLSFIAEKEQLVNDIVKYRWKIKTGKK